MNTIAKEVVERPVAVAVSEAVRQYAAEQQVQQIRELLEADAMPDIPITPEQSILELPAPASTDGLAIAEAVRLHQEQVIRAASVIEFEEQEQEQEQEHAPRSELILPVTTPVLERVVADRAPATNLDEPAVVTAAPTEPPSIVDTYTPEDIPLTHQVYEAHLEYDVPAMIQTAPEQTISEELPPTPLAPVPSETIPVLPTRLSPANIVPELFGEPAPAEDTILYMMPRTGEAETAGILTLPEAEAPAMSLSERLIVLTKTLEPEQAAEVRPVVDHLRETVRLVVHLQEVGADESMIAEAQTVLIDHARELCAMLGIAIDEQRLQSFVRSLILSESYDQQFDMADTLEADDAGTHERKYFALERLSKLALGLVATVRPEFYSVGRLALSRSVPEII